MKNRRSRPFKRSNNRNNDNNGKDVDALNYDFCIFGLKNNSYNEISNYENRLGELENQLNLSRNELAVKIDDILKLEKLKSNLQIEIENIISNNKEINTDLLQERDYSKTLEEKIASLKDKAILEKRLGKKYVKFKKNLK